MKSWMNFWTNLGRLRDTPTVLISFIGRKMSLNALLRALPRLSKSGERLRDCQGLNRVSKRRIVDYHSLDSLVWKTTPPWAGFSRN